MEQQPFNSLVQWLAGIENEQGYAIDRASIDRGSEKNRTANSVFADLRLETGIGSGEYII